LIKRNFKDIDNLTYQNSILEDKLLQTENNNSTLQSTITKLEIKESNNLKRSSTSSYDNAMQLNKFVQLQKEITHLQSNLESKDTEIVDLRSQLNFSFSS